MPGRENGTLKVLKKKLSLQPLFAKERARRTSSPPLPSGNKKTSRSPSPPRLDESNENTLVCTSAWDSRLERYRILKLDTNLSVSIGDSFEANPGSEVTNIPKFEYGPIRYPKMIRLLLILPATYDDEPLETIMFHADPREIPYQALSCASNDRKQTKLMHCNGHGLAVTETVYSALVNIRNLGDRKIFSTVWTDAVCINQADMQERESHLRLCKDIFSTAAVTIAHLDGTEKSRRKVFETVDMFHEACRNDDFRQRLEQDELDLSSLDQLCIGDKRLRIPLDNRVELSKVFSHPWFERVWNWPEVSLSKKVYFLYGSALRPWSFFADAAWCMHQLRWESSLNAECIVHGQTRMDLKYDHMLHLDDHRQDIIDGRPCTLLSLLTKSRRFTSANPLDRVFALWPHISNSSEREFIQAYFDYSLSPLTVFLNLTLNSIISHETLDVLHLIHNEVKDDWLSFVPDLWMKDGVRTLGSKEGREHWEYHAAGDTKPQFTALNTKNQTRHGMPYFEEDVNIMLKGILVDEVTRAGSEMKDMMLGAKSFLSDWVNTALMTGNKKFYTPGELKRAKALQKSSRSRSATKVSPSPQDEGEPSRVAELRAVGMQPNGDSHSRLRDSLTPSLMEALENIDIMEGGLNIKEVVSEPEPISTLPVNEKYPISGISTVEAFWRTLIKNKDENGEVPSTEMSKTSFQPWFTAMSGSIPEMVDALSHGRSEDGPRPEPLFNDLVHMSCNGSRIVRTKTGLIGTAPWDVQEGDFICVLYGGQTPFVLRGDDKCPGKFRFVGDCYIHGIMEGEALSMELEEREFVIS
ncbi:hypothetical protein N0V84_005072 [Fusarium piperis]|uniref:Heterokaryon incompatibility domain-containing protein n=1 Tax=Fusarium piperis TaxID=1435070 RepID=A0A9W9BPA8_9HYPO|nr:hypothetical protein N0V84_005072 [Fusarium piperis]